MMRKIYLDTNQKASSQLLFLLSEFWDSWGKASMTQRFKFVRMKEEERNPGICFLPSSSLSAGKLLHFRCVWKIQLNIQCQPAAGNRVPGLYRGIHWCSPGSGHTTTTMSHYSLFCPGQCGPRQGLHWTFTASVWVVLGSKVKKLRLSI